MWWSLALYLFCAAPFVTDWIIGRQVHPAIALAWVTIAFAWRTGFLIAERRK